MVPTIDIMCLDLRKPDSGFVNINGIRVHPCSLSSTFIISSLESIISNFATSEISIF